MTHLILSIGSNVDAQKNIAQAIGSLRNEFGDLTQSTVYESEAVGFSGDNFLNLTLTTKTDRPLEQIANLLKELEDSLGRDRTQARFSDRTIDIDILIYGDERGTECGLSLPREEILKGAFVLKPLAETHPELQHPDTGQCYRELWEQFDQDSQKLWPTEIRFDN